MLKNKNYKIILGVIVGIIISVSVVSAAGYVSSTIAYDSTNSSLSSGDVQGAIDDLADKINSAKSTTCPDGYLCTKYKTSSDLELGDYVSYTPIVTSYIVDKAMTGCSYYQTIYPSELNLWRVLNINDDGTVDIISEYVSSTAIIFSGQTGYLNFIGYLNVIASQYENSEYTIGSRYFGYNRYQNQIEYLDPTKVEFTNPPPFTSPTSDNSKEEQGGGDILHLDDFNKVESVLGTAKAYIVSEPTKAKSYWMASRYYYYGSSIFDWNGRYVNKSGSASNLSLYSYYGGLLYADSSSSNLRPIVILKSGLGYTGNGTTGSPWQIVS